MWVERRGHPKCHNESRWTHLKYDAKEDAHYKVTEGLNRITWEHHLQNKQCSFAKSPMVIGQSFAEVMNVSPALWWSDTKQHAKKEHTHILYLRIKLDRRVVWISLWNNHMFDLLRFMFFKPIWNWPCSRLCGFSEGNGFPRQTFPSHH